MSEGKMGTSYITINAITGGVIFGETGLKVSSLKRVRP